MMGILPDPPAPRPKLPPRHALRIPPALAIALADARALHDELQRIAAALAGLEQVA